MLTISELDDSQLSADASDSAFAGTNSGEPQRRSSQRSSRQDPDESDGSLVDEFTDSHRIGEGSMPLDVANIGADAETAALEEQQLWHTDTRQMRALLLLKHLT